MVKEFDGKLDEVSRRLGKNKLVAFVKGHFDPDIRKLRDDMNKIIEYLSNTRDGQVIKTVNMYPFEISASDIAQIRNVNAQLFYLLNKEMTIQGDHEQTNDKNYDTEN